MGRRRAPEDLTAQVAYDQTQVDQSPIAEFLDAVDRLNSEAAASLFAPEGRLLCFDGHRAEGIDRVRRLLDEFVAALRSSTHKVTAEWRQGDVWIAEVEVTYTLQDYLQLKALPRAFVLRGGPQGIVDLRIYGAHERELTDHRTGEEGWIVGGRWVPPV